MHYMPADTAILEPVFGRYHNISSYVYLSVVCATSVMRRMENFVINSSQGEDNDNDGQTGTPQLFNKYLPINTK